MKTKTPVLYWERSSWKHHGANVGPLSVSVRKVPHTVFGPGHWRVDAVLGNNFTDAGAYDDIIDAKLAAERAARVLLRDAAKAMAKADAAARRTRR